MLDLLADREAATLAAWLRAHPGVEIIRYEDGLENAAALARAHCAHDFRGSYQTVRRALVTLRRTRPRDSGAVGPLRPRAGTSGAAPSPRQTAWLLRYADAKPEDLSPEERACVAALGTSCPALARARALASAFVLMRTDKDPNALDPWLAAAAASELRAFAVGLRRDHDVVLAAVIFPWSNGQNHRNVLRPLKMWLKLLHDIEGRSNLLVGFSVSDFAHEVQRPKSAARAARPLD